MKHLLTGPRANAKLFAAVGGGAYYALGSREVRNLQACWEENERVYLARAIRRRQHREARRAGLR